MASGSVVVVTWNVVTVRVKYWTYWSPMPLSARKASWKDPSFFGVPEMTPSE